MSEYGLERDEKINFYNMLQRLRNGDGDSESEEEEVSGPSVFISNEAACPDGSPDEDEEEHGTREDEDDDFIDHSEQ